MSKDVKIPLRLTIDSSGNIHMISKSAVIWALNDCSSSFEPTELLGCFVAQPGCGHSARISREVVAQVHQSLHRVDIAGYILSVWSRAVHVLSSGAD
jgi:hypothetical protein